MSPSKETTCLLPRLFQVTADDQWDFLRPCGPGLCLIRHQKSQATPNPAAGTRLAALSTDPSAGGGLVFNQSRLAIISPPLIKLHGLSLAARIKFKSLMLAYKGRAELSQPTLALVRWALERRLAKPWVQARLFWSSSPTALPGPFLLSCLFPSTHSRAPSSKQQLVSCNRSHLWPLFTLVFYHLCAADSFSSRVAVRPPRRLQIPSALG